MKRASWYRLHRLLSVQAAIFLCFILLTGTLAVVSHELDWLSNPAIRADTIDDGQQPAWATIYHNALEHAGTDPLVSLRAPIHNGFAATVVVRNMQGERYRLYFNPVDGRYQGRGVWLNWQMTLRHLHRHLLLPTTLGITLVTSSAFLFLGLLISGLALQRNGLRSLFNMPRRSNPRVFWGELHRLTGLWSSWLLLVVTLTGFWYLLERWGLAAEYPENRPPATLSAQMHPSLAVFEHILQTTSDERPELEIKRIKLPQKVTEPLLVEGQAGGVLLRDRANNLAFSVATGERLSTRRTEQLSLHVRISEAADPLHFGTWGGYPSKVIYFIFGVMLTSVSITGTYLFILRIRGNKHRQHRANNGWRTVWYKIGQGKWFSLLLVGLAWLLLLCQLASR